MNTKANNSSCALTLIEVLVIVAVIFLLAAVLLLRSARSYAIAYHVSCQNNLKMIGLACLTWEGDHGDRYPMAVPVREGGSQGSVDAFRTFQVMSNEIGNPIVLICPSDNRRPASDFTPMSNTNLSYFAGLDADECFPVMPLAGDRNLFTNGIAVRPGLAAIQKNTPLSWSAAIHKFSGNLCLADGSVSNLDAKGLNDAFAKTGLALNRLAVP